MRITLTCETVANNGHVVFESKMFDSEMIRCSNIDLLNYECDRMQKNVNQKVDQINAASHESSTGG